MNQSSFLARTGLGVLLFATGACPAQSTVPSWSSYFSGSARDAVYVVRRGPGRLVTIVGQSTSTDLPVTPGCLQPANAGGNDVFVARIDPDQSPDMQLQWCTYLGGSDLELAFDAEVDPSTGVTTVVGVTKSTDFPAPAGMAFPTLAGTSDGFVAQLDAQGAQLISSMCVGGSLDDRLCEVELDATTLEVIVAGVTESPDLPATAGTVGPVFNGGPTDAFIARVFPVARTYSWAAYVGGNSTEGTAFANYVFPTTWETNLDRMAMALDGAGRPVLATVTVAASIRPPTTPNAAQPGHAGASDAYLAVPAFTGTPPLPTSWAYATFLGGSAEDRPHAIALHPGGGYVVAGYTFSVNFPTTPGCLDATFAGGTFGLAVDGFVSHIDPAGLGVNRVPYSTYFGGSVGEDAVMALAVDMCGHFTVAGYTPGYAPNDAPTATTTRCLQGSRVAGHFLGVVASIRPAGLGAGDLFYSTYVGGLTGKRTLFVSLALDELGDAIVGGETTSSSYPQERPLPCPASGLREGAITYLPLLAGGVFRDELSRANPACAAPLHTGAGGAPVPGATFTITACDAPPNTAGFLVLGGPLTPTPLPSPFNGWQLVGLAALQLVFTDGNGCASFALPVPAGAPPVPNWGLAAQWFALTTPACPGSGVLANSERLSF